MAVSVRLALFFSKERALANLCRGRPMPGAACCRNPAGLSPALVGGGGEEEEEEECFLLGGFGATFVLDSAPLPPPPRHALN